MKTKKIVAIVTAFVLTLALTSCGEPKDKYDDVYNKFWGEDQVTATFVQKLTVETADEKTTSITNGTYKKCDDDFLAYCVEATITLNEDESNKINFEKYYSDGKYYLNVSGSKAYSEMDEEQAMADLGVYGVIGGVNGDQFDAIVENPDDNGRTKLDFIIKDNASKIYGIEKVIGSIASSRGEGTYEIKAISGSISLDGKLPLSQEYTVNAEAQGANGTYKIIYEVSTTFDYDSDVKIVLPNIEEYKKIG